MKKVGRENHPTQLSLRREGERGGELAVQALMVAGSLPPRSPPGFSPTAHGRIGRLGAHEPPHKAPLAPHGARPARRRAGRSRRRQHLRPNPAWPPSLSSVPSWQRRGAAVGARSAATWPPRRRLERAARAHPLSVATGTEPFAAPRGVERGGGWPRLAPPPAPLRAAP